MLKQNCDITYAHNLICVHFKFKSQIKIHFKFNYITNIITFFFNWFKQWYIIS